MSYSWGNNKASGNSRQVNGNIYGDVTFSGDHYYGSESIPDLRGSVMTSLYFNEMQNYRSRELSVSPGTFQWIFDAERTTFTDWLQSNSPLSTEEEDEEETTPKSRVFWVHGKAGSGKSTLMKFMAEHKRTREILSRGEKYKVVVAAFFAWNAGTELEKTILGLLRSLVHQLLVRCPELLEDACPSRFGDDVESPVTKPWSREELFRAFTRITDPERRNLRFVLFVDGIDEMTEQPLDIIDTLDLISKSWTVKLCISGRPWNPFKKVYGTRSSPHQLSVQDHNEGDIRAFVTAQLKDGLAYIRGARIDDQELDELCRSIVLQADGVFFWVVLAVKSLRRSLTEGDDVEMLTERLEHFPTEIQALLAHVFDECIDPAYRRYTARTLLLLAAGPQSLFYIWLSEKTDDRFRLAFGPRDQKMTTAELVSHLDEAEIAVNKWCRELVTDMRKDRPGWSAWGSMTQRSVSLSHRCVKDFVNERRGALQLSSGDGYHPELTELRISARFLGAARLSEITSRAKFALNSPGVEKLFSNLHREAPQVRQEAVCLLQEIEKFWESHSREGTSWPYGWKPATYFTGISGLRALDTFPRPDFLSYLLSHSLHPLFLTLFDLQTVEKLQTMRDFWLACACSSNHKRHPYSFLHLQIETVKRLLGKDADLNKLFLRDEKHEEDVFSIWQVFLLEVWGQSQQSFSDQKEPDRDEWESMRGIIKVMLDNGANADVELNLDTVCKGDEVRGAAWTRILPAPDAFGPRICGRFEAQIALETERHDGREFDEWINGRLGRLRRAKQEFPAIAQLLRDAVVGRRSTRCPEKRSRQGSE